MLSEQTLYKKAGIKPALMLQVLLTETAVVTEPFLPDSTGMADPQADPHPQA